MIIAALVLTLVSIGILLLFFNGFGFFIAFICSVLALIFASIVTARVPKERVGSITLVVTSAGIIIVVLLSAIRPNTSSDDLSQDVPGVPDSAGVPQNEIEPEAQHPAYKFSSRELAVLRTLLYDDFFANARGVDSLMQFSELAFVAAADEYQKDYDKNEAAADLKYLKKTGVIRGKVDSIGKGFDQKYFIAFDGRSNSLMQPQAQMAEGHVDFVASLEKKQQLTLFCTGAGMSMGAALVKQCLPIEEAAVPIVEKLVLKLKKGTYETTAQKLLVTISLAIAPALSDTAICDTENKIPSSKCQNLFDEEFEKYSKTDSKEIRKAAAKNAAQKLGIDWIELAKLFSKDKEAETDN